MKNIVGIYIGMMFPIGVLIAAVANYVSLYPQGLLEEELAYREWLVYSPVIGFLIGYLLFGLTLFILDRFIKFSSNRVFPLLIIVPTLLFIWILISSLAQHIPGLNDNQADLAYIGSMIGLLGGLLGVFFFGLLKQIEFQIS